MATLATARRVPNSSQPQVTTFKKPSLSEVVSTGNNLPNRLLLHAVEGWGKTSFAAQVPHVLFLQTRGETGLETLISANQIQPTPHLPEITSFPELLDTIDMLTVEEHPYKALALDVVNGAERLCHEEVCRREFNGEWSDKGFLGYQRGYEISLADWTDFLSRLDKLRLERKIAILLLCHTKVGTFKNPAGPDFDRYQPDMHAKTWALTHKWADIVLFGNFETFVQGGSTGEEGKPGRKGKGAGGNTRMLYAERTAAYDAKNRIGLPAEIEMGDSPEQAWTNFRQAVAEGRRNGNSGSGKDGE